jgi:UDP-2,3-diacylglucosamine pyrophosphatase LpxH
MQDVFDEYVSGDSFMQDPSQSVQRLGTRLRRGNRSSNMSGNRTDKALLIR